MSERPGRARRVALLVAGMSGLRLDRPPGQIAVTVGALVATVAAQHTAASAGHVLWTTLGAGALYYVGNTLLCSRAVSSRLCAAWGHAAALRFHEVFLGVAFANQAAALGLVAEHTAGTLPLPRAPVLAACAVVSVVGAGTKLWATSHTGLDIYYYRDLFLRRPVGELVERGPYRYLQNPMYGIGNVHSYAPALAALSVAGLVVAFAFHVAIYVFHVGIERPFVARLENGELPPAGSETPVRNAAVEEPRA